MNVTKDVIADLIPLYVANECSPGTRALVEEYFRQHPEEAAELRRILSAPLPRTAPTPANLDEMESLQKARRVVRRRSWLLGAAIFFSLAPFSLVFHKDGHYWLFRESPASALIYAALGLVCWIAYAVVRRRSRQL
jgi:ferric-dicitrate binding protein FerR (iron transport regulator)